MKLLESRHADLCITPYTVKNTFSDVYHMRTEMMMPCHTYQALSS